MGTCPDYDLIDPSTFLPSQGVALVDIGLEVAGDDEISSCIDDGGSEYSYYWEAPSSGCVQVMAMSDTMDLGLYAFDDCNGTELSCNDDSSFVQNQFSRLYGSYIELDVVAAMPYIFVVESEGTGTGAFDLHVELNATLNCDGSPLE